MRKVLPKILKIIGRANKTAISVIVLSFLIVMGGQQSNRAFAVNLYTDSFPGSYSIAGELPRGYANHDCPATGMLMLLSENAMKFFGPGVGYINYCAAMTSSEVKGMSVSEKIKVYNELTSQNVGLGKAVNLAIYKVLDQQPASALIFAEQQIEKFKNAGTVYAAVDQNITPYFPGTGQEMLAPIQNFWGWAVTLSYSALVLITIAVAIMLIFGDRLGGKQRVTLNAAIQGIVLAMILIPLSYPLAGLFIDLTTLGANSVRGILIGGSGPASSLPGIAVDPRSSDQRLCDSFYDPDSPDPCPGGAVQTNPRGLYADDPNINVFNARNKIGFYNLAEAIGNNEICGSSDPNCSDFTASEGLFGFVDGLIGFFFGGGIATILGSIVFTILNIAMLLVGIRIAIILLKKYLWMLFAPIMMPFSFIAMAIPGMGAKVAFDWVKRMAAGAAVFITAYTMTLFAVILSSTNFMIDIGGGDITYRYVPPLFGGTFLSSTDPNGIVGSPSNLTYSILIGIIGMAIYFAIPSTLHAVAKKIEPDAEFNFPGLKSAWTEFRSTTTPVSRYGAALGLGAARAAGVAPRQLLNREGGAIDSAQKYLNNLTDSLNRRADQGGLGGWIAGRASAGLAAGGGAALSGIAGKSVDVGIARGKEGEAEFELEIKPDDETARILSGSGESYTIKRAAFLAVGSRRRAALASLSIDNRPNTGTGNFSLDSRKVNEASTNRSAVVNDLVVDLTFEVKLKTPKDKNARAGNIYFSKPQNNEKVVAVFTGTTEGFGLLELDSAGTEQNGLIAPSGNPYFTGRDSSRAIKLKVKFDILNQVLIAGERTFSLAKKLEVYVGPAKASKSEMIKREANITINVEEAFTVI